jgi:hypothetical protein
MAVELTATDYSGVGTGSLAVYGTGIYANASDQIKVYVNGSLQTLGDNYSLNGIGSAAGVNVVAVFAGGATVYIERDTPITQLVDTQNNETILEDVLDAEFDKLTLIAQEANRKLSRAMLVPKGETAPPLPPLAQRAGYAAWDGAGGLIGTSIPSTLPGANITILCATRAAMAALLAPIPGSIVALSEAGREGFFICRAGSVPVSDPLQGIYVVSATPNRYFERLWDGDVAPPEWFGGKAGDINFNNAPILQAMHDMGVNWSILKQYYIGTGSEGAGTVLINITRSGFRVRGLVASQTRAIGAAVPATSSELIIKSPYAIGILVGPAVNPGGSGVVNWIEGVMITDVSIPRLTTTPIANPASGITNAPAAMIVQYAQVCTFARVYTSEHSFGIRFSNTVAIRWVQCRHLRYTSGANLGNDFYAGFYQDNTPSSPFVSGNASVFYLDCGVFSNMAAGNSYTYNAGIQIRGGFTDTFIKGLETANCGYGVDAEGRSTTAVDYQTQDFEVSGGVFDGCRWAAVRIGIAGPRTSVKIIGNYCHVSNATGPVSIAIYLDNVQGLQTITANEILANPGNPAIGIYGFNSSGFRTTGNIISDLSRPVLLENCVGFIMDDAVCVSVVVPGIAAIEGTNCQSGELRPLIKRSAGAATLPCGVQLNGTLNRRVEVRGSGINSDSITGGAANKLKSNGASVSSTGTFNTDCLYSGIAA